MGSFSLALAELILVFNKVEKKSKREEFIERLHKIDKRFSNILAFEGNYKDSSKRKVLMTPATEFYRIYKQEIESIQKENEGLRGLLKDINKLSKLTTK